MGLYLEEGSILDIALEENEWVGGLKLVSNEALGK